MSIPTKMKFLVRGKSVDFQNREGSSPSIPKTRKGPVGFFNYLSFQKHCTIRYVSHSFSSFTSVSERKFDFLSQHLWYILYMIHVQTNILAQGIPVVKFEWLTILSTVLKLPKSYPSPEISWIFKKKTLEYLFS